MHKNQLVICLSFVMKLWQAIKTFSTSAIRFFHFLIICVLTTIALLISFKNVPCTFTTWLPVWHKRPSFWPILTFKMLSPLNLIISSFPKAQVTLSSTQHLRGQCRVINWLNFNTTVSQRRVRPKEGGEMVYEWLTSGEVRTYTFIN